MNILTFDIEEWAIAKDGGLGTPELYARYDKYLNRILGLLDERRTEALFFCTGRMAQDFPQVVKLIHKCGHEIGCHSLHHTWMNKMQESDAREDTHSAVDALEQCIGQKVVSYRAPAFSIGEKNKWMFEILAENGIIRDSSVFPAGRDFGGFPAFQSQKPCIINYAGISIKEYPISMTSVFGKQIAYSGGGYFRSFPLSFVRSQMAKSDYTMCYFHINDLLPQMGIMRTKKDYEAYFKEPGTLRNRCLRYVKSNLGRKRAWGKFEDLIKAESFKSIEQSNALINWAEAKVIEL